MTADSAEHFDRDLDLLDCVLLSLGGMIGSAIFVFPGSTGRLAGASATLAWLLAGILMAAIALCYTELTLAFPHAGAPAVFPYETLGPWPEIRAFASYLEGVGYAFGWVFGITVSALAIAGYLGRLFPAASGYTVSIALLAVGAACGVNLLGVQLTSRTNLMVSAFLLAVLVMFVVAGLASAAPTNYRPFFAGDAASFLAAVQIATTAYGAWTVVPSAIEEVQEPSRTAPRAIILSLAVAAVFYTAIVAVVHGVLPISSFGQGGQVASTPLGAAAATIGLPWLRYLLSVGAVAAIFTTMLVGTLSAGRVVFALGDNGTLPEVFARTNSYQVPWVGVLAVTLVAGALATFPGYFYELLVVASIVGTGMPYGINLLSFVGLRIYRTDVTPSFRVPGGLVVAGVAGVALAITMVGLGSTEIVWSLAVLGLVTAYYLLQAAVRATVPRATGS